MPNLRSPSPADRAARLMWLAGLSALATAPAWGAGGDSSAPEPEIVNVSVPAGRATAPDLNIKVPQFNIDTTMFNFPSGLTVMFQKDNTEPVVAITSVTDHGSSDDPQGKEGIAHLVEHLWFRSEHGELPKVWDLLDAEMGCDLNAFTQYDITAYMTVCPGFNLEAMLKLESLRITDTVRGVTEPMVTTEVEVVRNEIRMRGENFNIPFFTAWEYINGHIFADDHPYHRPIAGDHTTIRNCKLADVQKFTEDFYRPETTTTMVVGDLASTNPGYLLDLLVRNYDLKLLHPKLTQDLVGRMPKEGVTNPDPNKDADWWLIPLNPDDPTKPLPYNVQRTPRAANYRDLIPPDPQTDRVGVYDGPVEETTLVVGWTLPAGYQGYDTLMQITGSILSFVVDFGLSRVEDPDIKEFQGCGILPSKISSLAVCMVKTRAMEDDDLSEEELQKMRQTRASRIASRVIDQVATIYDPELRSQLDFFLSRARMEFLAETLRSLDLFAAVGSGRATDISQYAHFTGDPKYHTAMMQETMQLQSYQIAELAGKWLLRERAGAALIVPLERDGLALKSADGTEGGHQRGGGEEEILKPSIDPAKVTPELVRSVMTVPDRSRIDDFKLPNGLRVVIMPHGDAPVVKAVVIANGGGAHEGMGMTTVDRLFVRSEDPDALRIAGQFDFAQGDTTQQQVIEASSGNLDGALWMLRERIDTMHPDLAGKPEWIGDMKGQFRAYWLKKDYHWWHIQQLADRHLNPGHPLVDNMDYVDLISGPKDGPGKGKGLSKVSSADVIADLKQHWRPDNATLLIVGRVDPREARNHAIKYFGGWRPAPDAKAPDFAPIPPPNTPKPTQIYVFDDPGKTQTEVELQCQVAPTKIFPSPAHELLSDIANMTLFAVLREKEGVVYSPYAYVRQWPGGTAVFYMGGAIQNEAALFTVGQFLEYIDRARAGKISDRDLRIKKFARAASYVLGQQSVDQMTDRLGRIISRGQDWGYFDVYAEALAKLSVQEVADAVGDCKNNAFISLSGPKDVLVKQLTDAGYTDISDPANASAGTPGKTFIVYDFKSEGEKLFQAADPKEFEKYCKAKAKSDEKKEEAAAKEEAESKEELTAEEKEAKEKEKAAKEEAKKKSPCYALLND